MGFFFKKANKTNRCLLCGGEVAAGKCTACGREAKPPVPLSTLNWQKVPLSVRYFRKVCLTRCLP